LNEKKSLKYSGNGFTVTYNKEACTHSGVCVKTLPNVFNPKNKPWVNTDAASKDEIKIL